MKVSIKTIKITSVISALSLVIALLMGAEYFKDASQIYLFGISWVTLQNTAFGIFGSAALAAVSAGIIYGVDKEAYLNKSEQYLIHVCTKSKTAFVQLTEANKILENGILSKNEKATFTGVSTIVSFIETQQEAIQPASMQFLFKRSQVASYNALLCRCHEVTQGLIQLNNKLQVKYGHWEINDAVKNAAQSSTGLDSPLLDEAKSCSEEDLRLTINQISWQLNNVIQYTTLAIHQLFYLQKKEDKLQSTFQLMDDQAQYYQKTLEVQAPTVDEKTIAEHQIKVVQQIASIEGILSDPHSPAITMMSQNPYAYVNVLTDALKNMRACRYEASVLYASDKKLIFDINTIVDDLGMLVEQIHTTITLVTSLRPEWIDYLQRNGIHLGQLKDGASIGVTTETKLQKGRTVQITTAETDTEYYKDSVKYIVPDAEHVIVQTDDTGKYLKLAYSNENYYKVTLNLSHAKVEGATVTQIKQGEDYTATIIADTGYTLPETAPDRTTYSSFSEDKKSASIEIKNVDENKTVSLAAIPNKYTVTFDGNGSTDGAMEVQTMTYDTSDALSENKYTRTGYNFAGWSTTKGETSEYPDKVSVKNLTAENNGNVTLYAVWTKKETIPAFDSGENAVQSSKYDGTGKAYTLTSELEGFTISYKKGEETVAAPTAVGTYDVIITRAEDDTYEAFSQTITGGLVITAADYPVSVVADKETMRGAGTVKLTADSTVDEIKVTGIVCSDDSIKPTKNEDGTYSVSLPNATKTYIFTAQIDGDLSNYGEGTASCTVSVSRKKSSSSSSDTSAPTYGVNTGKTENGKISVTPAKAEAGEKVTIKATPDSGYQLDKVTVKDKDNSNVKLTKVNDNEYTFTMPKGKVSVDATFVQKDAADANQNSAAEKSKVIKLQIGSRIVNVDNEAVIYDAAPVIRNDRTLVPIRIVTETLGGKVDWNGATKEVTLHIDGKEIKMTVGKTLEKYGVAPVIIDGRTFVPVRFVADELGATVAWDDATKTVTITKIEK